MSDNNKYLEPYYDIAYNNHRKYLELIKNLNDYPFTSFNGILQKKYVFEQIRYTTELHWWIEEFFELWFSSYSKETLEQWLTAIRDFRINLNNCISYYIWNNYLLPSEQSVLKYLYIDIRRLVRRVRRRLIHKI